MANYKDAQKTRKRANERHRHQRRKYDIDVPMANYKNAQKARKRAIERYRYQRRKYDIYVPYDELKRQLPKVDKGLSSEEYDELVEMFDNMTKEDFQDIVNEDYLEPEDETSPYSYSYFEEYRDRLDEVDPQIASQFSNMIQYVQDYTSMSGYEIEEILEDAEDYIDQIEENYNRYNSNKGSSSQSSYYSSIATLNKMMREMFHIYNS